MNKEEMRAYKRQWYRDHRNIVRKQMKIWYQKNKARLLERIKERYRTDPVFRAKQQERCREYSKKNAKQKTIVSRIYHRKINKSFQKKYKNVYFDKIKQEWRVQFGINHKDVYFGCFEDLNEAIKRAQEIRKSGIVANKGSPIKYHITGDRYDIVNIRAKIRANRIKKKSIKKKSK